MNNPGCATKLWNKDFILFLICNIQFSFGSSLSGVALSFLVLKLTHSPSAMSITLALWFLPSILTPFMATFVDRMSLKPPMLVCVFFRAIALTGLYIGLKSGYFNIHAVYVFALVNGLIWTILIPASQSLIPNLIPKDQLARGNSLLAMTTQSMRFTGLICGGLIVAIVGPELSLLIEGICYFIALFLLFFVSMPAVVSAVKSTFRADFMSGIKIIHTSTIILILMIASFFLNALMSPLEVLLPVHMTALGRGAFGYGLFMGLITGGMVLGNLVISIMGKRFKHYSCMIYGWLLAGVALAGLGILNSFYFSLFWGVVFGISLAMLNTGTIVILQTIVPAEFRARVFGTLGAVAQVGIPISLFALSYMVKLVTLKEIFLSGMSLSLVLVITWFFLVKKIGVAQTVKVDVVE